MDDSMNTTNNPVAILREALEKISRNEIPVFDEDENCTVLAPLDSEEMMNIAYIALAATEHAATQPADCLHDDTVRQGAIWTACNQCGKRWADDEAPQATQPAGDDEAIGTLRDAMRRIQFCLNIAIKAQEDTAPPAPVQAAPVERTSGAGELPPLTMSVYGTKTELDAEIKRRQSPPTVTGSIGDDAEFQRLLREYGEARTQLFNENVGVKLNRLVAYLDARSTVAAAPDTSARDAAIDACAGLMFYWAGLSDADEQRKCYARMIALKSTPTVPGEPA